jgi:predicted CoA-binding protein
VSFIGQQLNFIVTLYGKLQVCKNLIRSLICKMNFFRGICRKMDLNLQYMIKKTLVLGASLKENRYSNRAIKNLTANNIPVVAIGLRKGAIKHVAINIDKIPFENIDTVTLYLNPKRQVEYYSYIISLQPKRVIFNPGTENSDFVKLLLENNIYSETACTLVLLATNQY